MATEEESWRKHFASNENGERSERPSFNRSGNGYQREKRSYTSSNNREGYSAQREGGYQRNNNRGYRSSSSSYNRTESYNQREGYSYNKERGGQQGSYNREGGYQSRPYNREGGYRQREGGYQSRPYNREGGYQQREGGYGQKPGYGYKKRTQSYNPHAKYSMKKQIEYKEKNYDPDEPVRLNRYLANAGVCSRREADTFIQSGVVKVNGVIITELGTKVKRSDEVMFHDQTISMEKKVYVLLNKPKDYVTTSDDPQNRKTVMDLVKNACRERIYPVGRLDRNTTGVLLLTNDGDLATKLTHPQYLKKKIYHVYCDKNVTAADIRQIAEGITLEDGEIHADAIDYAHETDKKQVGIEIHSGRNRIVRRIFEHFGYKVVKLDRVYFAGLTKKNVKRGDWRFLTQDEVNMLKMGAFE
ncbi:MAG: RNA-binding S4 domain-containing protein [Bacteroidaceae bacterium]|nr:RNA-binding S4 domain-containing protein [Bacteroidaceae bacterium]MBQ5693684.1 RNA-binding S4 domain-containing protein [Bacteroidaceae bacterium]MBQ5912596.1 RNA-binding S4 domain-containing protein [Bacteroidaceae bacterium]